MALDLDPRFLEFFRLFQEEKFFEAHEVLEGLWRETRGEKREPYLPYYEGVNLSKILKDFENFLGVWSRYPDEPSLAKPFLPRVALERKR